MLLKINQLKININENDNLIKQKIIKLLKIDENNLAFYKILHKSIDARDKNNILFVYNIIVKINIKIKFTNKNIEVINENLTDLYNNCNNNFDAKNFLIKNNIIKKKDFNNIKRPIVVGFGPSGIFSSYILSIFGLKPIIFERGSSIEERVKECENFFENQILNENSNVSFGEGGAGTFSDGKLNTHNKNKNNLYEFILKTFVKFGAPENILYENLPHIGTDVLRNVIINIRNEIIKLGGEIHFNTKWSFEEHSHFAYDGHPVILAIGNSSRDTFLDLINNNFNIKPKAIAIGYRYAVLQNIINKSQYGEDYLQKKYNNKSKLDLLSPATYNLKYKLNNNKTVYTFCMCPGGYIINSSNFQNHLSINGMSYNNRSGAYSNSAIVETVTVEDVIKGISNNIENNFENKNSILNQEFFEDLSSVNTPLYDNPLIMINFQNKIENKFYKLNNGLIPYKILNNLAENNITFNEKELFVGKSKLNNNLLDIYDNLGLEYNINTDIFEALKHFNKIIHNFYDINSKNPIILAGCETRTSSPIKLERESNTNYMCNIKNYYPAGEGLGHGGGIMSCAEDGILVALNIINNFYN